MQVFSDGSANPLKLLGAFLQVELKSRQLFDDLLMQF